MNEFIQDSEKQKYKFPAMDKVYRTIMWVSSKHLINSVLTTFLWCFVQIIKNCKAFNFEMLGSMYFIGLIKHIHSYFKELLNNLLKSKLKYKTLNLRLFLKKSNSHFCEPILHRTMNCQVFISQQTLPLDLYLSHNCGNILGHIKFTSSFHYILQNCGEGTLPSKFLFV